MGRLAAERLHETTWRGDRRPENRPGYSRTSQLLVRGGRSPFLRNINHLFEVIDGSPERVEPTWKAMHRFLGQALQDLYGHGGAFRQTIRPRRCSAGVRRLLPAYRQFHEDLLFHQTDENLFQPFFIGRACEAVLAAGRAVGRSGPDRAAARAQLNDYLGHRPVAVLRTRAKNPALRPRMGAADPLMHPRGAAGPWDPTRN